MKFSKVIDILRKKGYKESWPPSDNWWYYENSKFLVDVSRYRGVRVWNKKTKKCTYFNPVKGKIESKII